MTTMPERMSMSPVATVLAAVALTLAGPVQVSAQTTPPDFSVNGTGGWLAMSADFIPVPGAPGPGPMTNDPRHPYVPNGVAQSPPGRVMVDNFSPDLIREAIGIIRSWGTRPEIEISGGITLDNVAAYAIEGVDFISTGSITASAPSLDLSLLAEGA